MALVLTGSYTWKEKEYQTARKLNLTGTPKAASASSATGTATISATADVIFCNSSSAFTLTLPSVTGNTDNKMTITNIGSGTVTVASSTGSQIFDTAAVASGQLGTGDSIQLVCNGTYWKIV